MKNNNTNWKPLPSSALEIKQAYALADRWALDYISARELEFLARKFQRSNKSEWKVLVLKSIENRIQQDAERKAQESEQRQAELDACAG